VLLLDLIQMRLAAKCTTTYEYDILGGGRISSCRRRRRLRKSSNPAMEKVTYTRVLQAGSTTKHTLKKEVRDFREEVITYNYDLMDRLASKALPAVKTFQGRADGWLPANLLSHRIDS
jgi:hypothetical protein